jgi:hypothetical protein
LKKSEKKFSKNWHTARHRNEGRGVCQFLLNFFFRSFIDINFRKRLILNITLLITISMSCGMPFLFGNPVFEISRDFILLMFLYFIFILFIIKIIDIKISKKIIDKQV